MFERKLLALEYHSPNNFEYQGLIISSAIIVILFIAFANVLTLFQDEKVFRNFISWLENQKIRIYKVEDRADLDNVDGENWPKAFENVS
jgi:RLL motif-containing protein 1